MALFKYLHPQYASELVAVGRTRVATLEEFRIIEGVRQDPNEGMKTAHLRGPRAFGSGNIPDFLKGIIKISGNAQINMGTMANIKRVQKSKNLFIYSTSSVFCPSLLQKFGGACVEITDEDAYFDALTESLQRQVGVSELGRHPCVYTERSVNYTEWTEIHPAIIKTPTYSEEREVRMIWQPQDKDAPIESMILQSHELTKYCRLRE